MRLLFLLLCFLIFSVGCVSQKQKMERTITSQNVEVKSEAIEYFLDNDKKMVVPPSGINTSNYYFMISPFDIHKGYTCINNICKSYTKKEFEENYVKDDKSELIKVNFVKKLSPKYFGGLASGNAYIYIANDGMSCRISSRKILPETLNSGTVKYDLDKYNHSISKLENTENCFYDKYQHYICTFESSQKLNNAKTSFVYDFTECKDFMENKLDVSVENFTFLPM